MPSLSLKAKTLPPVISVSTKVKNTAGTGLWQEISVQVKFSALCPMTTSTGAAASFVITEMLKVNIFDSGTFACLQIPMSYTLKGIELKLDKKQYIDRAHRRNIAVQYWTINDEADMRYLIELGCDAIMTDNPRLLREVLNSYK